MGTFRRIFLVDLDNTLIDADAIKQYWQKRFGAKFESAYQRSKSRTAYPDVKLLINLISSSTSTPSQTIEDIIYTTPFKKFLLPNTINSLKQLKKFGKVIIYTLGDPKFQKTKLQKSGITKVIPLSSVLITKDKAKRTKLLIPRLIENGNKSVFVIDDRIEFLKDVGATYPEATTVWIRYGVYADAAKYDNTAVAHSSKSFSDSLSFVIPCLATLESKTKTTYFVKTGITTVQTRQLIRFSNNDPVIKEYTKDGERFKNLSRFKKWKNKGKTIFILSTKQDKLAGIIWFSKKVNSIAPGYPHTFGIRIYSDARGSGLAKKFMSICFKEFGSNRIWLSVKRTNTSAIKLYLDFGFKKVGVGDNPDDLIMTYRV